jgi:hypothetical protein
MYKENRQGRFSGILEDFFRFSKIASRSQIIAGNHRGIGKSAQVKQIAIRAVRRMRKGVNISSRTSAASSALLCRSPRNRAQAAYSSYAGVSLVIGVADAIHSKAENLFFKQVLFRIYAANPRFHVQISRDRVEQIHLSRKNRRTSFHLFCRWHCVEYILECPYGTGDVARS